MNRRPRLGIAARLDDHYELVAGAFSSDPARAQASAEALRVMPARALCAPGWQAAAREKRL